MNSLLFKFSLLIESCFIVWFISILSFIIVLFVDINLVLLFLLLFSIFFLFNLKFKFIKAIDDIEIIIRNINIIKYSILNNFLIFLIFFFFEVP